MTVTVITTTGASTWTVPAGVTTLKAAGIGAGGAGRVGTSAGGGAGGSGGAYACVNARRDDLSIYRRYSRGYLAQQNR